MMVRSQEERKSGFFLGGGNAGLGVGFFLGVGLFCVCWFVRENRVGFLKGCFLRESSF